MCQGQFNSYHKSCRYWLLLTKVGQWEKLVRLKIHLGRGIYFLVFHKESRVALINLLNECGALIALVMHVLGPETWLIS